MTLHFYSELLLHVATEDNGNNGTSGSVPILVSIEHFIAVGLLQEVKYNNYIFIFKQKVQVRTASNHQLYMQP